MSDVDPRLLADGRGMWRESTPGRPSGIEWGEVYSVSGHNLDGASKIYTCLASISSMESSSNYHDWFGFRQVVATITEQLPGIRPDWISPMEQ